MFHDSLVRIKLQLILKPDDMIHLDMYSTGKRKFLKQIYHVGCEKKKTILVVVMYNLPVKVVCQLCLIKPLDDLPSRDMYMTLYYFFFYLYPFDDDKMVVMKKQQAKCRGTNQCKTIKLNRPQMCGSTKYLYPPQGWSLEILRGRGGLRSQNL